MKNEKCQPKACPLIGRRADPPRAEKIKNDNVKFKKRINIFAF